MSSASTAPKIVDAHDAIHRINVSWLIRLRWGAIVGQAAVIAYVEWGLKIGLPLAALSGILAVELVANVVFEVWLRSRFRLSEPVVAAAMALDVSCFTGLLYLTGGPLNPFSFLYLVHIALAALVLRQRWAWTLVLLSIGASAALFVRHIPLPMDHGMSESAHHHMMMHHGPGEPLDLHLRGMWVAFAVAAAFIVYFINRVTGALSDREAELGRARELAARTEKLASMATLAAGAAHELSTPLSTIAVIAKELERAASLEAVTADARLVREQVERCRAILIQMAEGAGEAPGEASQRTSLEELVRIALGGLTSPERVRLEWAEGSRHGTIIVPPRATAQALRNVLSNGIDASPDDADVILRIAPSGTAFRFEIDDSGSGMSPEVLAHATEPFFTTKDPGRGMGLGLFLTRSVVEHLGGDIDIDSTLGRGTRVVVTVPDAAATNGRILVRAASVPRSSP
jgi:two-component system sensor histidine kinase RegB